jgi:hypothetical protein
MMPNIEQQQQTITNYNAKYWTAAKNKNQLWYQILNNMNKHKPTIIPNIEQEEQTIMNYDTKYRTAATNKIQL